MPLTQGFTFQFKDDGVILNTDSITPFVDIHRVSGLDSSPLRTTERQREGMDGGFIDAEFEQMRTIVIEGILYATVAGVESFLDSLKANYAPSTLPQPFYFLAEGSQERVIFCKSLGIRYDWETMRRTGRSSIQIQLKAEDPAIYGQSVLVSTSLGGSSLGRGYNKAYNYGYGGPGQTAGNLTISNTGNRNTFGILTITGPIQNPVLVHDGQNRSLDLDITLGANDYLDIDLRNKTVKLNGTANRRNKLKSTSRWFSFKPGDNVVRFLGTQHIAGPPNPSLQISTRSAYR